MIRIIVILLLIIFFSHLAPEAKSLTLTKDKVWSGKIDLEEDIIVPAGYTLTISPGTQVITNGNKIISYGTVNILGEEENNVSFKYFSLSNTSSIEVVKVKPYNIDTETLKEEFNTFKIQYAILWSVLFASTFLMLEAR